MAAPLSRYYTIKNKTTDEFYKKLDDFCRIKKKSIMDLSKDDYNTLLIDLENWGRNEYGNNQQDLIDFLDIFWKYFATEFSQSIYTAPPPLYKSGGRRRKHQRKTRCVRKHRRQRRRTNKNRCIR
jgi:hypothetical protein